MLPILTGNVGINGGNSGARESTYTITIERLPVLENPVKTAISCFSWTDAIARGPEMTALRDGVAAKRSWMCRLSLSGTMPGIPSSTSIPISIKPTKFCRTKKMRNDRGDRELYDLVGEICRHSAAGPDDRRAGRHYP
jgi:hypothetical protein